MQVYQQFDVGIISPVCIFIGNETPVTFSCDFREFLQNTHFAEHLRRGASKEMIIARFFCKIYFSIKWKIKRIAKIITS